MDIPQAWGSDGASEEGWGEGHSTDQDVEARGSVPFQSHMQSSQQHEVQDDSDPHSGDGRRKSPHKSRLLSKKGPWDNLVTVTVADSTSVMSLRTERGLFTKGPVHIWG